MTTRVLMLAGLVCFLGFNVSADDWPQFRGPKRDGISKETGLLKEWPAEGPKLVWQKKDVAGGGSGVDREGRRLFDWESRHGGGVGDGLQSGGWVDVVVDEDWAGGETEYA